MHALINNSNSSNSSNSNGKTTHRCVILQFLYSVLRVLKWAPV